MEIILEDIGKRFTTGWVFRGINQHIHSGNRLAITGRNGSGKSTLLQIICGYLTATDGKVTYTYDREVITRDNIFKQLAISAAYSELDEELTALELFRHYRHFKKFLIDDESAFLDLVDLQAEKAKQVQYYSSGMKQRLSLALAMAMDVPLLILDEPTSFLDSTKRDWFHEVLSIYGKNKTVIIASNEAGDIKSCDQVIDLKG